MVKAVVFDLGGTLMEYKDMPLNWEEYYYQAFQNVNYQNKLNLSETEICDAVTVLKGYNPRNCGRKNEVPPEKIFEDATGGWTTKPETGKIIEDFFSGMSLEAHIFDHAEKTLNDCRSKGLFVACLTDLPNGMPDRLFRNAITAIEPLFDLYVSSQICGVRKPDKKGIEYIAGYFGIEVSEILFVGDEKKDEDTAVNAGCRYKYIEEYLWENTNL